jgi:hypothetical protein
MTGYKIRTAEDDLLEDSVKYYFNTLGYRAFSIKKETSHTLDLSIPEELYTMGVHKVLPDKLRNNFTGGAYDTCPTWQFFNHIPGLFVVSPATHSTFLVDCEICASPIYLDNRIHTLRSASGIDTLSKDNVGAIEAQAFDAYKRLATVLDINVVLVVYSSFHTINGIRRPLLASSITDIRPVYSDWRRCNEAVASDADADDGALYVNVNLDDFTSFNAFVALQSGYTGGDLHTCISALDADHTYQSIVRALGDRIKTK